MDVFSSTSVTGKEVKQTITKVSSERLLPQEVSATKGREPLIPLTKIKGNGHA